MKKKIHQILAASLMAGVFAIAPVHAQDSGGTDAGGAESGADAGADSGADADADAGADAGADADADVDAGTDDPAADASEDAPEPVSDAGATTTADDITPEQANQLRQIIVEAAPQPVTVDVEVSTGVVVPDTVALQPLPAPAVEVVPAYDTYQYFSLSDGRIAIVEPTSMEIVYVLEN
jgi:hypothetical protein